jgi:hypothetical protein
MGHPVLALLVSAMGICWGKGHILSGFNLKRCFLHNKGLIKEEIILDKGGKDHILSI